LVTFRKGAAYQASKSGLVGLTAALRAEYRDRRFGMTALCPGLVRTPFLERQASSGLRAKLQDLVAITPEVVAARAIRAIRRNEAIVVLPASARLLWWFARLSPGLLDKMTREAWRH
jgi:short-subunit dehydrogenase